MTDTAQPLAGIRILDMATVLAAPMSATLCADLGAEVVKLELPDGSDALRALAPVKEGMPLYWKVTNRGKKGLSLDVRTPEGRQILLDLIRDMDVLVENFRPGTLEKWGLGPEVLHGINPRLLILRLTAFGQGGPLASRPGFGRIFEAMSGLTQLAGEEGGQPLHMNFPIGDTIAGLFGAFALAAELVKLRSDPAARGVVVDLSATEAVMRLLEPLPVEREQLGITRGRTGNRATYTAPSSMYRTADGTHITLVASSDATFRRLCDAIGEPALATDPRFANNVSRTAHSIELEALLSAWFARHSFAEAVAALAESGAPFTKVYDIDDVLADPHFQARQAVIRLPDPDLGSIPAPCVVPRVQGRTPLSPRSGPAIGEHNAEVLGTIGLDAAALAGLKARGVI